MRILGFLFILGLAWGSSALADDFRSFHLSAVETHMLGIHSFVPRQLSFLQADADSHARDPGYTKRSLQVLSMIHSFWDIVTDKKPAAVKTAFFVSTQGASVYATFQL